MINNNIKITKNKNNNFIIFDPQFKQPERKILIPVINWLCSMDILNDIPQSNKEYDLIEFLKGVRCKYDNFELKQIDFIINF